MSSDNLARVERLGRTADVLADGFDFGDGGDTADIVLVNLVVGALGDEELGGGSGGADLGEGLEVLAVIDVDERGEEQGLVGFDFHSR